MTWLFVHPVGHFFYSEIQWCVYDESDSRGNGQYDLFPEWLANVEFLMERFLVCFGNLENIAG